MEELLEERSSPERIVEAREIFLNQISRGEPSNDATFNYAVAMVGSGNKFDIKEGIHYLEKLSRSDDSECIRNYVYYLAVGHARLKQYDSALNYANALISSEPENMQAKTLKKSITTLMSRDGMLGAAIVGGTVAAAGILTFLVMSLRR